MSQSSNIPATVTTTLESLSRRPNVQSTLILSRHDGTIISVTGALAKQTDRNRSPAVERQYEPASTQPTANIANGIANGIANTELSDTSQWTPAEKLADSIFQFVKVAIPLGFRMEVVAQQEDDVRFMSSAPQDPGAARDAQSLEADSENSAEGSDLQLLRLRTKKQEIIIYPDAKFLCCVIQAAGRSAQSSGDPAR